MQNLAKKLKITHLVVAFDSEKKSFRHQIYKNYKGTRKEAPEELLLQIPVLKKILKNLNIAWLEQEGLEADDIIASFVYSLKKDPKNWVYILSEDKDLSQLIQPQVTIVTSLKGKLIFTNNTSFFVKEHYYPGQTCDFKALVGDTSDNIRGVTGIGKVTAKKLLANFFCIEGIFQNLEKLTPNLQKILSKQEELVFANKALVRLVVDKNLFLKIPEEDLKFQLFNSPLSVLIKEFENLGLFE